MHMPIISFSENMRHLARNNVGFVLFLHLCLSSVTRAGYENTTRGPKVPYNDTNNKTTANFEISGCNAKPSSADIAYSSFLILVIAVAVIGNATVIATIFNTYRMRSQPSIGFVVSLAVSDILTPLVILPFRVHIVLNKGSFCYSDIVCKLVIIFGNFFQIASLTTIFLISIDRFVAVVRALSYVSLMSDKRVSRLIFGVWIYSAAWTGLFVFKWKSPSQIAIQVIHNGQGDQRCLVDNFLYFIVLASVVYFIPLVLMGLMFLKIFSAARRHARAINAIEISLQRERKISRKQKIADFKLTRTIAVVYAAFLICWLPNCILTIHSNLHPIWWLNFRRNDEALSFFVSAFFVKILPPLSSTLNPFIYSLFSSNFRSALKATIYRALGREGIRYGQADMIKMFRTDRTKSFRNGQSFTSKMNTAC